MIAVLAASAVYLAGLQASVDAPRREFWSCAKVQTSKAKESKVGADGFEDYLRNACSSEIKSLQSAIASLDVKNGMSRKAADLDAVTSINDYVFGPVDTYKGAVAADAPAQPAAAAKPATASAQSPSPQPGSARPAIEQPSSQPPKP